MIFRSPKRYKLVATGNKISETTDGKTTISVWKSDLPLAVAGFAFGDYKVYTEKVGSVEVEIYANRRPDDAPRRLQQRANPDLVISRRDPFNLAQSAPPALGNLSPSRLAKTMGAEVANTLRLFENYFGPYPYKRLAVTNIPYDYGQGWPMLIYLSAISFLDSNQRQSLGITERSQLTDSFRAHESSHQWWGHRVGWKSYHDQWISEGFAQFSGNLYVQFRRNEKEYRNRLRQDKEELLGGKDRRNRVYETLGPVWMGRRLSSGDSPRGYSTVIHNKGGYILHMLRMMLFEARSRDPEARFKAMMRDFCQTFHNKPASTEDFKAIVEKHMTRTMNLDGNGRMDWFFRQYVYGTGIPQYRFRYTVQDAGDGKWRIAVRVPQSGVPAGWKDVLTVYLHGGGRVVRLGALRITQKETRLASTLPLKPDKLSVNYNEDLLAKIKQ